LPQRTQYFLVGRFAFPQLAQVLIAHQPLVCTSVTICNKRSKGFPNRLKLRKSLQRAGKNILECNYRAALSFGPSDDVYIPGSEQ
jgi:hypothetical protein